MQQKCFSWFETLCFVNGRSPLKSFFAQMSLDADALKRIERIKCDLLDYCRSVLGGGGGDSFQEPGGKSPAGQKISPTGIKTPTLATPFSKNFSSRAADAGNSPLTPSERRASRFREEILKIEEMAQVRVKLTVG